MSRPSNREAPSSRDSAGRGVVTTVLVVTGSRAWPNSCHKVVEDHLVAAVAPHCPTRLLVGDCPDDPRRIRSFSVDARATLLLRSIVTTTEVVDAFWETHKLAAGPIRNTEIVRRAKYYLDGGCRVIALAFPLDAGTKGGTWDCVRKLRRIGVDPEIVRVPR